MCGIAGIWGAEDRALVERMLEMLAHRGPDGRGIHSVKGRGTIGSARLAIMDPEHGRQPLFNEDGKLACVANGEIYNYPALRSDLEQRHTFATRSDSEAIVHLFEERRHETFSALDGMFAIAIADGDHLVLARDPIGIKPLYYAWNGKLGPKLRLRFASELKALHDAKDPVKPLPPGGIFDTRSGLSSYYNLALPPQLDAPDEEIAARVRNTLAASVKSHLMSDVPVGVFISGGLDSSTVAALVRPHVKELHTFTVGTEGSTDIRLARLVADTLGTIHHEYIFGADEIARELPNIAYHIESYDRYMVTNGVPNYFCARLAKGVVKVALIGEGADEIFAGYDYFQSFRDPEILRRELHRNTADLHQTNLQRVDRMSMAHGIECRVPFITPAMVELALSIPPALKLREDRGRMYQKWILRKAFDGLLPDEIIWGTKRNFDEGSGALSVLEQAVTIAAGGFDFTRYKKKHRAQWLRRREEIWCHKILSERFGRSPALFDNVARWGLLRLREPHDTHPTKPPQKKRFFFF